MRQIVITIAATLLIGAFAAFTSCGEKNEPAVQSPFSHLDTVKTKAVEKEETKDEPKKEGDGTSFSPFDNINKNK